MPARVLIVDDQLISRMRIRDVALAEGWEVAGEAGNGADAVESYVRLSPDLVTMDMIMPEMDGLAALERIRLVDPEARVVMISAVDQRPKLLRAIELGAVDFLVKPVDRDRLAEMFRKARSAGD
jgi:two-component system chemotaxis response regulator CheY